MSIDNKHDANSLGWLPRSRSSQQTSRIRKFLFFIVIFVLFAYGFQTLSLNGPSGVSKWLHWNCQSQPQWQQSHDHLNSKFDVNISVGTEMFYEDCDAPIIAAGSYGAHWWSGDSKHIDYPFEYNRGQKDFKVPNNFHRLLYAGNKKDRIHTDLTWKALQDSEKLGPIGDKKVTKNPWPADAPLVSRLDMPRWYPTELGYRTTAVWRAILTVAIEQEASDPVAHYMRTQVQTTKGNPVQTALYPSTVQELIISNSAKVHKNSGQTWIGMKKKITGEHTPPFSGIEVGYDKRMVTWQRGGVGPLSVEAAFILATQVAGVDFKAVASTIKKSKHIDTWWSGVLMPVQKGSRALMCLNEEDFVTGGVLRLYGKHLKSGSDNQHDQRAGVYVAFDLDPLEEDTAADHNVFVFIVHALDRYSTINIEKDSYLREVKLTRYEPSESNTDAKVWGPKGGSTTAPPLPKSTKGANTRPVAHAHAGSMKRSEFVGWLKSKDAEKSFPQYSQFSQLHLYILTEDWELGKGEKESDWPRKNWLSAQP